MNCNELYPTTASQCKIDENFRIFNCFECTVWLNSLCWFLAAFNLLTDVGIFVESSKAPTLCDEVLNNNTTDGAGRTILCSGNDTFTRANLEGAETDVRNILITTAVIFLVGGAFFLAQLVIYFKYLIARSSSEFEYSVDRSTFLKHFYKIHGLVLFLEAMLHDLPIGFAVVELCMLVWRLPNCWECVALSSNEAPDEVSLSKTNLWLGIKLASVVPITLYKGMFPMFMWIGGPFCGMDCYICRVCVVIPCGVLAAVLLLTPLCGTILFRLVPMASGINKGVPDTVWTIGLIFWAMTIIVGTLFCVICVPGCRACCFRYGPCKWLGLDCCGLGAKKKKTIKVEKEDS